MNEAEVTASERPTSKRPPKKSSPAKSSKSQPNPVFNAQVPFPGIESVMPGNGAVAHVMEHVCDGVIGYPITPSTEISEIYEAYRASGGINVWDRRPFFFEPEGEHSAQSGAMGAALTGGKYISNASSSQGILYGLESHFVTAGKKIGGFVLQIAARVVSRNSLNVMAGHDDVYALLPSGYTIFFGSNPQESADLAAIAYRSSSLSLIPAANAMDGFSTSHMQSEVLLPEPELLKRYLGDPSEFIPLTLADWDVRQGNIDLVIQGVGTSTKLMNQLKPQQSFAGIAGPLGRPSVIERYDDDRRVVFVAGGVGLPPVLPILKEHLELGNQTVLISGFRNPTQTFWHEPGQRLDRLQSDFPNLEVIYTSDDGSFGLHGLITQPLETMLKQANTLGPGIGEVIAIGPPLMMRAVSELTRPYGVKTIASLNSVMIDATGMCGACMVPIHKEDQLLRKHACVDGPEFDAHSIDWEKLLPRFKQFNLQELRSQELKGLS